MDSNAFWKLINNRRKKRKHTPTFEMKFNDAVCNNPLDINTGWMTYFTDLYSLTKNDNFDSGYRDSCEQELSNIKMQLYDSPTTDNIPIDEIIVEKKLKTCKKGKACGNDQVYYEHIQYGGHLLTSVITKLFQYMYKYAYTPTELKRGIISTLFKGGNKPKSDPNSYRAISLCSTILKLYEKLY